MTFAFVRALGDIYELAEPTEGLDNTREKRRLGRRGGSFHLRLRRGGSVATKVVRLTTSSNFQRPLRGVWYAGRHTTGDCP